MGTRYGRGLDGDRNDYRDDGEAAQASATSSHPDTARAFGSIVPPLLPTGRGQASTRQRPDKPQMDGRTLVS